MNSRDKSYNSSSGWKRKKDGKRRRLRHGCCCGHIFCRTTPRPYALLLVLRRGYVVRPSVGFTTFQRHTSLVLIYSSRKGKRDIRPNKTQANTGLHISTGRRRYTCHKVTGLAQNSHLIPATWNFHLTTSCNTQYTREELVATQKQSKNMKQIKNKQKFWLKHTIPL